jgi:alanyl-tRNA synthetase
MKVSEIRKKYIDYFVKNSHAHIPSSSIIPENDPTTLFTGSGMQPLIPYLLGQEHPKGFRLVDSQKCFRAEDIDEVGDNRHTTFFEMLGNWSLGDYFKKEQLPWVFKFLTQEIGLDPSKIYVTCFIGDDDADVPKDKESADIWVKLFGEKGIDAKVVEIGSEQSGYDIGMNGGRIFYYDASKNWWSRSGVPQNMPVGEIGGPDSEIFYDFGLEHDENYGKHCHPNCDCGRFMEIGNSVFIEYIKNESGNFEKLKQRNVDFGGGLERIAAAQNNNADVFEIDIFANVIEKIEEIASKKYTDETYTEAFRIVVDHLRGAVFMLSEGLIPSNKEQGYVLRRLIRRGVFYGQKLTEQKGLLSQLAPLVIDSYKNTYAQLKNKEEQILNEINIEEERFNKTLQKGLKKFEKMIAGGEIDAKDAFVLFSTYGFPLEMTIELARENGIEVDMEVYKKEFDKHREISRGQSGGKFKGGLADNSQKTKQLHTVTHIMLAGLRKELGDDVHQAGSNITPERIRFDFTYPEKVDREILDKVEQYVNEALQSHSNVVCTQMPKEEAREKGVEGSFWEKYPDVVDVYTVGDDVIYSQELCGGPHVENTDEIEGVFKIVKEKSSGAGVRRIKAIVE